MPARQAVQMTENESNDELQDLLDELNPVVDLADEMYDALDIRITTIHSGMKLQNGIINIVPGANIGNIKFIQGKWGYPAGVINFTFENITFRGSFNKNDGLQERNEALADKAGCGANAVTNVTYKAGTVTFINCRWEYLGNSGVAIHCDAFIGENLSFHRVAKHCIGLREVGGCNAQIDRMTVTECGNALDFHGDGGLRPEADVAVVNNLVVTNSTGRAKVSGNNWDIQGSNWSFIQDSEVNMNTWAGFDLTRAPRRFHLNGVIFKKYPIMSFSSLANQGVVANTVIDDMLAEDSMAVAKVQQVMTIQNSTFEGFYTLWRSGTPTTGNNTEIGQQTAAYWAAIFDNIRRLYDEKNAEWGTAYGWVQGVFNPPGWSVIPSTIKNLMETE